MDGAQIDAYKGYFTLTTDREEDSPESTTAGMRYIGLAFGIFGKNACKSCCGMHAQHEVLSTKPYPGQTML